MSVPLPSPVQESLGFGCDFLFLDGAVRRQICGLTHGEQACLVITRSNIGLAVRGPQGRNFTFATNTTWNYQLEVDGACRHVPPARRVALVHVSELGVDIGPRICFRPCHSGLKGIIPTAEVQSRNFDYVPVLCRDGDLLEEEPLAPRDRQAPAQICSVLDTSPNKLLGYERTTPPKDKHARLSARLNAAANVLVADDLQLAVRQVEVLVECRKGRRARR